MQIPLPCEENIPLAQYSTFGSGGPARYLVKVKTIEDAEKIIFFCSQNDITFLTIGKGSNCLFDDRGFNGMVIVNHINHFLQREHEFVVGSGFSFSLLGTKTASLGYKGLEFAAAIPATVGGAVFMNAGSGGGETFNFLKEVRYIDMKGEKKTFQKKNLSFNYRYSSFQDKKGMILEATFLLTPCSSAKNWQKENIAYRIKTQPYKDKSAGCAFKNPEGTTAGKLIESCNLKGFQIGGAKVSELHANFVVNTGSATTKDVLLLIDYIREKVWEKHKIRLKNEIRVIRYE